MNGDTTVWKPPGPGAWEFDRSHTIRPEIPLAHGLIADAMEHGFAEMTAAYGFPFETVHTDYVNGYGFTQVVVVGVRASDRPPPPRWLLRLATRVSGPMRERRRTAEATLAGARWRSEAAAWGVARAEHVEHLRTLTRVDVAESPGDDLARHFDECLQLTHRLNTEHFRLLGATIVPVGRYVVAARRLGVDDTTTLATLRGSSPATAEADRLLTTLRHGTTETARAAARDQLELDHAHRLLGSDLYDGCLGERADWLERLAAASAARASEPAPVAGPDPTELLADARVGYGLRDDHAGLARWAGGLARRAALEADRRYGGDGTVFFTTTDELRAALQGRAPLPIDRATERRVAWSAQCRLDPPRQLGPAHAAPAPDVFAGALGELMAALGAVLELTTAADQGLGVGAGLVRGRAVVAGSAFEALERLQPGDVLVTATTDPSYNPVIALAAALVTEEGGPLSHSGIVAREYGIPAVLGIRDACSRLAGTVVEVDPGAGTVRVVS